MKKAIFTLTTLLIFTTAYAQIPASSINLGGGIYGNKVKPPKDGPASLDCPCGLQSVVNNSNDMGYGFGNVGNITIYRDYLTPSDQTKYEGRGISVYHDDIGIGSHKKIDIGYDFAVSYDPFIKLSRHDGLIGYEVNGETCVEKILDPASGFHNEVSSAGLTSIVKNNWPDEDGRMIVNPVKADTCIDGMNDSGLVLTYLVPAGGPYTYLISGYWMNIHNAGYVLEYVVEWVDRTLTPRTLSLATMTPGGNTPVKVPAIEVRAAGGTSIMVHVVTDTVGAGVLLHDVCCSVTRKRK